MRVYNIYGWGGEGDITARVDFFRKSLVFTVTFAPFNLYIVYEGVSITGDVKVKKTREKPPSTVYDSGVFFVASPSFRVYNTLPTPAIGRTAKNVNTANTVVVTEGARVGRGLSCHHRAPFA